MGSGSYSKSSTASEIPYDASPGGAAWSAAARNRFGVLLGAVVATAFLFAAAWGAWELGLRLYLLKRGVEVQGVVREIVDQPVWRNKRGRIRAPVTVKYAFATQRNGVVSASLERDQAQLGGLSTGRPLSVLYVEGKPQLNLPRPLFGDLSTYVSIVLACLGAFAVAAFMTLRFWRAARQSR